MTEEKATFQQWALLEIMGHNRFAGYLTEVTIAGAAMLRLDVPEVDGQQAYTRYFSMASVYSISPVTEEIARGLAKKIGSVPVNVYDLPEETRTAIRRGQQLLGGPTVRVDTVEVKGDACDYGEDEEIVPDDRKWSGDE